MTRFTSLLTIALFVSIPCFAQQQKSLFNGKNLKGWETFIGPKEKGGESIGLNNDTMNVFSVVKEDNEPAIRISGEINGAITTTKKFSNYHLQLQFKYGQKVYTKRNSGILYHSVGDYGVGLGVWKSAHEFQMMHGNVGDSYRMGNTYCDIPCKPKTKGKGFSFEQTKENRSFGKGEKSGPICGKSANYEKSIGEWNTLDLYCYGQKSIHVVNGKCVMINYDSEIKKQGKYSELEAGQIQIQSEGGELFLKEITVEKIKKIPPKYL